MTTFTATESPTTDARDTGVDQPPTDLRSRSAAWTAAAMFGGGGFVGLVESALPGGPRFSVVPSWIALLVAGILALVGHRFSRPALAVLAPVGVVAFAYTLATRHGGGDGVRMYLWLDVVVAVAVLAVVTQLLARRADHLVTRLERSEARFRELADGTPDIVFRFSRLPDPHFEYLSPSFETITGVPVATVEADFGAFAVATDETGRRHLADVVAGRNFQPYLDLTFRRKNGTFGVFELHVVETADGTQGIARDVTEIRALQAQLADQATRDPLTGLANRRLLDELLGRALCRASRSDTPLTVAFLDLDKFKSVNDTYGHAAGDAVLRATATRLQATARDTDVVARYGGDEFVVVYEGADNNEVRSLVDRIHIALSAPIDVGGGVAVHCYASIGIADTRTTAPNAAALIGAADRAMLEVKKHHARWPRHVRPEAARSVD